MASETVARHSAELTATQLRLVLETIAGRSNTLNNLLMHARSEGDKYGTAVMIDAAQAIATQIGAMADTAIGGDIIGMAERWNYGPNFTHAGAKEA